VTFKNAPDILGQLYCQERSDTWPSKNFKHHIRE